MQAPIAAVEWLFTCRPGFEPELVQELGAIALQQGSTGFARTDRGAGLVRWSVPEGTFRAPVNLVFARQSLRLEAHLADLDRSDRVGPVVERIAGGLFTDVWVEPASADDTLAPLARALESALVTRLRKLGAIDRTADRRLHVLLRAPTELLVATADIATASPWRGGIPRLKFPHDAPSRSTLKLEEAFLVLLSEAERDTWLRPGMTAVDLGASPGGWTYQLVRRSIRVTAVDNGPMDERLMQSGLVEHRREDGFRFRPKKPMDWLVCDMVEQPIRVAALVRDWFAAGACRRAIFNLKLPMKKRWDEVVRCLALFEGDAFEMRAKQLYHDREEVTLFVQPRRQPG